MPRKAYGSASLYDRSVTTPIVASEPATAGRAGQPRPRHGKPHARRTIGARVIVLILHATAKPTPMPSSAILAKPPMIQVR